MKTLFERCDFLNLIEKVAFLIATGHLSKCLINVRAASLVNVSEHEGIHVIMRDLQRVNNLTLRNPAAFKHALRRDFLRILDYLRTSQAKSLEEVIAVLKWWMEVGASVGLSEAALRHEAISKSNRTTKKAAAVGCIWHRCFRFEQDDGSAPLFACTGCGKARYCSVACQDR